MSSSKTTVKAIVSYRPDSHRDTAIIEMAIRLSERGFSVLPVKSHQKVPWTRRGYKSAQNEKGAIRALFNGKDGCNLGISTHIGLVVVDIDPRNGGMESLRDLEDEIGCFPPTVQCTTGGGGIHFYFDADGHKIRSRAGIRPGIDIKAIGGYVVAPPSTLDTGGEYKWVEGCSPFEREPAPVPTNLLNILEGGENKTRKLPAPEEDSRSITESAAVVLEDSSDQKQRTQGKAARISGPILEGTRNVTLASIAGTLNRKGIDHASLGKMLQQYNADHCSPPLSKTEVSKITKKISRYPSEDTLGVKCITEPPPRWEPPMGEVTNIADVQDIYLAMMPGGDPGMLRVAQATYASNWLHGPPVWLIFNSAARTGKSRTLQALTDLPSIQTVGNLTESALISGTPQKYRGRQSSGGILLEPGEFRILVCDEFSQTMTQPSGDINQLFAVLRTVHDGHFTKSVGAGGGQTIRWKGKRGLLIAATPEIDKHERLQRRLGPRFLQYRRRPCNIAEGVLPPSLEDECRLHVELKKAVVGLFSGISDLTALIFRLPDSLRRQLFQLATFIAMGRGIVETDDEGLLTEKPEIEPPIYLLNTLSRLYMGCKVIGVDDETAIEDIERVAKSTIPPLRLDILKVLSETGSAMSKAQIRKELSFSTFVVHKVLSELIYLKMVIKKGSGRSARYSLSNEISICLSAKKQRTVKEVRNYV